MILRGALLSETRTSLAPARIQADLIEPQAPPVRAQVKEATPAAEPKVIERVVPAAITYEAVVEWLQDSESRRRLAEHLAHDLDSLRAAARAEGLAAGREVGEAAGLAEAKEQAATAIRALESLVAQAEHAFQAETDELSAQCAEIVCAALAKIAGPVLSMREAALGTVLEVIKRVKDDRELIVRVSAHDLPALREHGDELERACAGRRISLVADPRVDAGGCIVESPLGSLDGRFDVQLRALSETLRAAKSGAPEAS